MRMLDARLWIMKLQKGHSCWIKPSLLKTCVKHTKESIGEEKGKKNI